MTSKLDNVRARLAGANLLGFKASESSQAKQGEAKLGAGGPPPGPGPKIASAKPAISKTAEAKLSLKKN